MRQSDNSLDFTYNSQKQLFVKKKKRNLDKHSVGGPSAKETEGDLGEHDETNVLLN